MRDGGFDFYLDEQYRDNCFARGFEYNKKIKVNGLTIFEVFEHFEEPMEEMKKLLKISAYEIKSLVGELTAKSMKLKVDHFCPESEFKKVKLKIVGF